MADFSTDGLIAAVRGLSFAPNATALGTADADIIRIANEVMMSRLVPRLVRESAKLFLKDYDTAIVAATQAYAITKRAIGSRLDKVSLLDPNNQAIEETLYLLDVERERLGQKGFLLKGNDVVLNPNPHGMTGTLRMRAMRRPSELVATAVCGKISSILTDNPSAGKNTLNFTPNPSPVFTSSQTFDFVGGSSPFASYFDDASFDATNGPITAVAAGSIVILRSAFATLPAVGDYVCLSSQTAIPQLPQDIHPFLYLLVARRLLVILGHREKLAELDNEIRVADAEVWPLVTPRVSNSPDKAVNNSLLGE